MGREGDLWDDSALVNAFNDAVSKYKKMHGKKNQVNFADGEKVASSSRENVSEVIDEDQNAARTVEENGSDVTKTDSKTKDTENLMPANESHVQNTPEFEPAPDSSNGVHVKDAQDGIQGLQNSHDNEDYNQLVSQYYELEEKRQKILQQLNQCSGWNYQYAGAGSSSSAQWGTAYGFQEHQVPTTQACYPAAYACCPYICQSCASCSACPTCGPCQAETCSGTNVATGPGNPLPALGGDIVKTAMGAAERAISSLKPKTSTPLNIAEEKAEKKDSEGQMTRDGSSETDLSVVLNAWYSAGFHTGKYLTEQSIAKKRHG